MSAFLSPPRGEALVEGLGARIGSLVPTSVSDGRLFAFHFVAPPGFDGPALHRHPDVDEAFYLVDGALTVQVDDQRQEVGAGQAVFVPGRDAHAFCNPTETPATFIGITTPAGRLEAMFAEIGEYVSGLNGPPESERLTEINVRHGIEIVGPPILARR